MEKQIYHLLRQFGVVRRAQLDAFFPGKEKAVRKAIRKLCQLLEALWVLAELKKRGLAEQFFQAGKEEYPIRIVVVGRKEMYDILYVGMEEKALAESVLKRIYLPDCKHLVAVQDMEAARALPAGQVFAVGLVAPDGEVAFYDAGS